MIPLWRGNINSWDCDEMGHANVRVYLEKGAEGAGHFAAAIDMPHAFQANSPSTLIPAEQHIRYINEAYAGSPLIMSGCVLDFDETSVTLYQDIRHLDGRPAAAMRTIYHHAESGSGRPFAWSTRSKAALKMLIGTPPDDTAPRSLNLGEASIPTQQATLEMVERFGAPEAGRGLVPPHHCDLNGRMHAYWFMGRLSDSAPTLLHDWRRGLGTAEQHRRLGAAVLEYRLVFHSWPRAGDRFVVHSSAGQTREKTHNLVHWILNPDTDRAYVTSEAVTVSFDLDTRKVVTMPKAHLERLLEIIPPGLTV